VSTLRRAKFPETLEVRRPLRITITMLAALALLACRGDGDEPTARIDLSITDAPIDDATSVFIQFSAVAFKRQGTAAEIVQDVSPSLRRWDLLQYQDGRAGLLLDGVILPAGNYEWIRLIVDTEPNVRDSYLVLTSGAECELTVPGGAVSGLKLNRGFTLPADGSVALTIDFDLRKSIHALPGRQGASPDCAQGYLMRPTLRIVDDADVGAIAGDVASERVPLDCAPKVYVFSGSNIVPDDIEESGSEPDVDPLVVARVSIENGSGSIYGYRAAFLPPGAYTVAFACADDDPVGEDVMDFLAARNVTVQANLMSAASFEAPLP
jgi:hypothetical protein